MQRRGRTHVYRWSKDRWYLVCRPVEGQSDVRDAIHPPPGARRTSRKNPIWVVSNPQTSLMPLGSVRSMRMCLQGGSGILTLSL